MSSSALETPLSSAPDSSSANALGDLGDSGGHREAAAPSPSSFSSSAAALPLADSIPGPSSTQQTPALHDAADAPSDASVDDAETSMDTGTDSFPAKRAPKARAPAGLAAVSNGDAAEDAALTGARRKSNRSSASSSSSSTTEALTAETGTEPAANTGSEAEGELNGHVQPMSVDSDDRASKSTANGHEEAIADGGSNSNNNSSSDTANGTATSGSANGGAAAKPRRSRKRDEIMAKAEIGEITAMTDGEADAFATRTLRTRARNKLEDADSHSGDAGAEQATGSTSGSIPVAGSIITPQGLRDFQSEEEFQAFEGAVHSETVSKLPQAQMAAPAVRGRVTAIRYEFNEPYTALVNASIRNASAAAEQSDIAAGLRSPVEHVEDDPEDPHVDRKRRVDSMVATLSHAHAEAANYLPSFERENDAGNNDQCETCGGTGELLCCDRCPSAFHLFCADPPVDPEHVPEGIWLCNKCVARSEALRTDNASDNEDDGSESNVLFHHPQDYTNRFFGMAIKRLDRQNPSAFILDATIHSSVARKTRQIATATALVATENARSTVLRWRAASRRNSDASGGDDSDDDKSSEDGELEETKREELDETSGINEFPPSFLPGRLTNEQLFDPTLFFPFAATSSSLSHHKNLIRPNFQTASANESAIPHWRFGEYAKVEPPADEGDVAPRLCHICGLGLSAGTLIFCSECPLLYHMDCLDPPLASIPKRGWLCPVHMVHPLNDIGSFTERQFQLMLTQLIPQKTTVVNFVEKVSQEREMRRQKRLLSQPFAILNQLDPNVVRFLAWERLCQLASNGAAHNSVAPKAEEEASATAVSGGGESSSVGGRKRRSDNPSLDGAAPSGSGARKKARLDKEDESTQAVFENVDAHVLALLVEEDSGARFEICENGLVDLGGVQGAVALSRFTVFHVPSSNSFRLLCAPGITGDVQVEGVSAKTIESGVVLGARASVTADGKSYTFYRR